MVSSASLSFLQLEALSASTAMVVLKYSLSARGSPCSLHPILKLGMDVFSFVLFLASFASASSLALRVLLAGSFYSEMLFGAVWPCVAPTASNAASLR